MRVLRPELNLSCSSAFLTPTAVITFILAACLSVEHFISNCTKALSVAFPFPIFSIFRAPWPRTMISRQHNYSSVDRVLPDAMRQTWPFLPRIHMLANVSINRSVSLCFTIQTSFQSSKNQSNIWGESGRPKAQHTNIDTAPRI